MKLIVFSIVPSPYQRDMFRALHDHSGIDLQVFYLEHAAPDSPWGKDTLEPWETVLPGFCVGRGRIRSHGNWNFPNIKNADVVVVNTALTDLTSQSLLRRNRALAPNAKWIFWGELIRTGTGLAEKFRRVCAAPLINMDAIVGIGAKAQQVYQNRFPEQTVFNLPYHCDLTPFVETVASRQEPRQANRPIRFIFCGQMIRRKGIDILIAAFGKLIKGGVNAELDLVGRKAELDSYLDSVPSQVRSKIHFHGFKPVSELPVWFANADVFVLPSRHDGWGVVINQAMGAGLPIISTNRVGAAVELVDEPLNGLVVEVGQIDALTQAMTRLSADDDLRRRMSVENGRRGHELSPAAGAMKWFEICQSLMGKVALESGA